MSKSNRNGRILEYLIVKEFCDKIKNTKSCEYTIELQKRDSSKINDVEDKLINYLKRASVKITYWLLENYDFTLLKISRISDSKGKKGDVTDIRLNLDEKELNLSIKHNHTALKHQRPGSTPQHLNFSKKSDEDILYRNKYKEITDGFFNEVLTKNKGIKLFKEVSSLIPKKLYNPICNLVSDYINTYGSIEERSNYYLKFLTGNTDYKKIIVFENEIKIKSFDNIPKSNRVSSFVENNNYVKVDFHNGIKLSMRLHTASSRITFNPSLKFDTKSEVFIVPEETLQM